ncbi:MAG TPA: lysophospholipid acyltransferase family protein [Gemmatimonadaceae bacterium]|nr:lysophospholipid acyltransferase family protein [Gemmatimonadaceae bacterium]
MLYALLRSIAGIALRWFYRRVDVEGLDRLPRKAPTLLVVNHPNALVDALLVGWAMPRRIVLTAKSTLFTNPAFARFLTWVGVVPLVRSKDVRASAQEAIDPRRNARSFDALRGVLRRGGAVVVFPEGISHDNPSLAPLRTGAARIALEARDEGGVHGLQIVPVGLIFERKQTPRTRVLVQVGEPIVLDRWAVTGDHAVSALTEEIDARLRSVTQNYETVDDASRAAALSALLAALFQNEPPSVGSSHSLHVDISIARRIDEARRGLTRADDRLRARTDALLRSLATFEDRLALHRVALEDISVSAEPRFAAPFVLRESWVLAIAGPIALWGTINHWLPFHGARIIARRSIESASDPAMRTIVAGAGLVLAFYLAQGALVAWLAGWLAAIAYVASLPLAADVNFLFRERLRRAVRRARTYLLFRRRPRLHAQLQSDLQRLRSEALDIEGLLREVSVSEAV